MTCTINASTSSSAIVSTADGSGVLKVQSNGVTTNALAWVRFAGSATPTINSSYNVSSITYNSTGNFTINFTSTMSDANYSMEGTAWSSGAASGFMGMGASQTTSGCQIETVNSAGASYNHTKICAAFFGN